MWKRKGQECMKCVGRIAKKGTREGLTNKIVYEAALLSQAES